MNKVKQLLHESNFTTGDRFSTVWGKVLANWVTDEVSTPSSFFYEKLLSLVQCTEIPI
jgi:hypothetical protein